MEHREDGIAQWKRTVSKLRDAGCVYAEDEARLLISSSRDCTELAEMVDRRAAGYPLEHIIGWADFCGIRIELDPGIFVPRQRTEFLVRQAAALTRQGDVVVDLCCGSGAIGAALTALVGRIELHAADIDPAAVSCARRNIRVDEGVVYEGDLYNRLPVQLYDRVHVIIANAPYVPTKAIPFMPAEARVHEARLALDGGTDGLDIQRRIVAEAPHWLAKGGFLLVETSEKQAPLTAELFAQFGLNPRWVRSEEQDANVIIGMRTES
jgi:release factor glutamine methyltransferase